MFAAVSPFEPEQHLMIYAYIQYYKLIKGNQPQERGLNHCDAISVS